MGEQVTGVLHHAGNVAAHVERMRGAVEEADEWGVGPADHVNGGLAVLDKIVRVRLEPQFHSLAFEDRQQLLHRSPELRFALAGRLRPTVELRIHHPAIEVHGQLNGSLPVPHRGLALVLVRSGPPVQR